LQQENYPPQSGAAFVNKLVSLFITPDVSQTSMILLYTPTGNHPMCPVFSNYLKTAYFLGFGGKKNF
jgi:hypothetical protein